MAVRAKHTKTSAVPDGGDTSLVQPSDWNADHQVLMGSRGLIGREAVGDGVASEIGVGPRLSLTGGTLDAPRQAETVLELVPGVEPEAPASNLLLYARKRANRALAHMIGPAGIGTALQPALFGNSVYMWLPGTGTTTGINFGTNFTARNSGTSAAQAHPSKTSTNNLTSMNRATFGTGTTVNGASGIQSGATVAFRGNAAGRGGFFYFARFAAETYTTDVRMCVGLSGNNAALAADPSTIANSLWLVKDFADTAWHFVSRDGSTLQKVSSGCTVTAGQILDLTIFCKPNDSLVYVRLTDAMTGEVYFNDFEVSASLPANTFFMYMQAHIQAQTGTTARTLALNRMYLETDL